MGVSDKTNCFFLSIKSKVCDKWEERDLMQELTTVAHAEALIASLDGTDSVAQVKKGRKTVYLCGTTALAKKMAAKGTCVTFSQGLAYMKEHRILPKLVAEINQPVLLESMAIFGGKITEVETVIPDA